MGYALNYIFLSKDFSLLFNYLLWETLGDGLVMLIWILCPSGVTGVLVLPSELRSEAANGDIVRVGEAVLAGDILRGLPSRFGVREPLGSILQSVFLGHCPKRALIIFIFGFLP